MLLREFIDTHDYYFTVIDGKCRYHTFLTKLPDELMEREVRYYEKDDYNGWTRWVVTLNEN